MTLTTSNYTGTTVAEVMQSLQNDANLMDFIAGQNLATGDVLEAIAQAMVMIDPATVTIDTDGTITTSADDN
jgi:hypothetical protein